MQDGQQIHRIVVQIVQASMNQSHGIIWSHTGGELYLRIVVTLIATEWIQA